MVSEIKSDKLLNQSGDQDSGIDLSTNDVVKVKTANTERMRIDSTGKVGIGVTPPTDAQVGVYLNGGGATYSTSSTYRYDMVNAYFSDAWKYIGNGVATQIYHANGAITFSNASSNSSGAGASLSWSERMRIDTDGKIGIGTSSPQEQLHVYGGSTAGLRVSGGGNNNMKCEIGYDNSAGPYIKAGSSGQTDLHIYVDNNSLAAEFRANTDFYSNDGTVHSLSDIRVKKDVADLTDGLDIVKQLKPKTFKYTEDSEFYNEKTKDKIKYGFVANEVEAVAPQYTDTGKGRIGGKEVDDFKTLSATKMIPMLVKAIQELEARVAALEAK